MNSWKKKIFKILFDICLVALAYFLSLELSHSSVFSEKPYPYIAVSGEAASTAENFEELRVLLEQYSVSLVISSQSWNQTGAVVSLAGTEAGLDTYTDWTGIDAGYYGSLIGTSYEVEKYSWENMPEIPAGAEVTLYFVSEGNAKKDLPAEVILGLGVGDLSGWKVDLKKLSEGWFWKAFAVVTAIMLLFEGYQALYETKGYVLRLLFGESIQGIVFKKLLVDLLVVGGAYAGGFLAAGIFFHETIPWTAAAVCFGIFMLGDLLINLLVFAKSWKRALVRVRESGKLLAASHAIRIVMLTALIVLCSANILFFDEYGQATEHEAFYDYFNGYGVLQDGYDASDYLYLELLKKDEAALIYHSTDYQGKPVVNVNQVTFGFLEQINNAFSFQESMDEKVVIYYPEGMEEPSDLAEHVIAQPGNEGDISFVSYRGEVDLPLQRGTAYNPELLTWTAQPIIIADFRSDLDFFSESLSEYVSYIWMASYLVHLEDEAAGMAEYVSETGAIYALKNVKAIYDASVLPYLMAVRYITMLLLLVGIMEVILSLRIVFLEFQMKTVKYISGRLLGAGFVKTYGSFLAATVLLCAAGGLCSKIVLGEAFSGMLCLAVCVTTGVIEMFIQMLYVLRLEKANFPKLLKGGIL